MAADDDFATVFQAFTATAHRSPDAAFFCVPADDGRDYHPDGAEFTYDEVLTAVLAMKARYEAAGYGHGHRVALLLENRPEFFHHYLALNALGVSIVPVNPDYRQDEMTYQLGHSDAALVIALSNRVSDCEAAAADTETRPPVLDAFALPAELPGSGPAPRQGAPGHDTECALLYTSGTTGRPKGCVLTNLYFLCSGDGYLSMGGTAALQPGKERILNPLPLFHMNALAVTATGAMLSGNCLISPDRFHPTAWWKDIRETGATAFHYLGVVPPMLLNQPEQADDKDHPARIGLGAGVDPKHHENFEKRFGVPLIELWGMTETGKIYGDVEEPRQVGTRAFGRPYPGLEALVVDEAGHEVPRGEEGELLVRNSADDPRRGLFSEYLKDEAATAEAWKDGWFHTGDTVRQAEDGMLYFVDRKKNIIRRAGENIAAAEVEGVLQAHEEVAQAAVIAVPDDLREEEVFACIVAMPGTPQDRIQADKLMVWALDRLAYFKAPGYILFMADLPTTGTQKVQKAQIFAADTNPCDEPGVFDMKALKKRSRKSG